LCRYNVVHYPSRDEQRAAAAKREEDEAWRMARVPLAAFFAKAPKGEPFPPEACRELLSALSELPFAEGRLAPRAAHAFAAVAAPPKAGPGKGDAELEELVRGVVNPLYHLLTYGVTPPASGTGSSVAASIAAQMHTAAVKLMSAALDILAAGAATGAAVENAKGIAVVREQVAALLSGKAPGGGRGDRDQVMGARGGVGGVGDARGGGASGGGGGGGGRGGSDGDRWGKVGAGGAGGGGFGAGDRDMDRDRDRVRDDRDDRRRSGDGGCRQGGGDFGFGRSPTGGGGGGGGIFSRLERPR
jgi:hypothetical protein